MQERLQPRIGGYGKLFAAKAALKNRVLCIPLCRQESLCHSVSLCLCGEIFGVDFRQLSNQYDDGATPNACRKARLKWLWS